MKKAVIIMSWLFMLSSLSSAQKETPLPFPVALNHFYLTLDSDTYAAIESSEFLQGEFAPFERRTTVRTDKTYTGIYFYGIHTYFEFFDATKSPGSKVGDSGVAFGVEQSDALKLLKTRLGVSPPSRLVTRLYKDAQVPWFYMLGLPGFTPNSTINSWVMEYHPQFLAELNPADAENLGTTRQQILRRYTNVLKNVPPNPYLQDVTGLSIAADEVSITYMKDVCESFGYHSSTDGSEVLLQGPEILLRLIPETVSSRGITRVELRVRQMPKGRTEYRFGSHSVLKFQSNERAIWTF